MRRAGTQTIPLFVLGMALMAAPAVHAQDAAATGAQIGGPAANGVQEVANGKQDTAAAKQDTAAAKQDTAAAKQDTAAAKQDTAAAKQDTAAAKQDTAAAKQDTAAAKQDVADAGTPSGEAGKKVGANAAQRRDPFRPFTLDLRMRQDHLVQLTPLQHYELGQLAVVATVWDINPPRAMVEDSGGMGYIVSLGTPIGSAGGVVTGIEPQRIIVEERVLDYYGKEQINRIVMETPKEEGPNQATRERQ